MRVTIERDLCIGCGACQATEPQVFLLVDGKSSVLVDRIPKDLETKVLLALNGCPVGAIKEI